MNHNPDLVIFGSRDVLASDLADAIAGHLNDAIAENGKASMALSGGSSPAGLYLELSSRNVDWALVSVTLVDERWVAPGQPGSNETFVRDIFVQSKAAAASFVGLWSDAPSPSAGLENAERALEAVGGDFDVVVLGMGPDGHTASWFPHSDGLSDALVEDGPKLAAVRAIKSDVTGDHLDRITLTLGAVQKAGFLCLLITGDEKRAVFENALKDGPVADLPVRAILRSRPDLTVVWAP